MPYCTKCGQEIPLGTNFCPNCGTPVSAPLISKPAEIPRPPEMTLEIPRPPIKKGMKRSRKALIVAAVVVFIIIATYMVANLTVSNAIMALETELDETGFSLWSPRAYLILKNPSDIDLTINILKAEFFIKSQGKYHLIGIIDVKEKILPHTGLCSIPVDYILSSDIIDIIKSGNYTTAVSGKISIIGTYLFWTITKEETIMLEK